MAEEMSREEAWRRRSDAEAMIQARLPEYAAELLEWDNTAILPDGLVRETVDRLRNVIPSPHQLDVVRSMVTTAAYHQAVAGAAAKLTPAQATLIRSVGIEMAAGTRVECGRHEHRAAQGAAGQGLLREVPSALAKDQMHFDVVVTPLGARVAALLNTQESADE